MKLIQELIVLGYRGSYSISGAKNSPHKKMIIAKITDELGRVYRYEVLAETPLNKNSPRYEEFKKLLAEYKHCN